MRLLGVIAVALVFMAEAAFAQTPTTARDDRWVAFAEAGYPSTWDDEGLLGRGTSVGGGVGIHVTPRLTVLALVERIPYFRDVEWLTFDGRVLFGGVEASFMARGRTMRPYVTAGYGVLNNNGVWIQKRSTGPFQPRVEERVPLSGTFAAMTVSAGLNFRITQRASILAGFRFYGVHIRRDIDPAIILQPSTGVGIGW